MNSNQRRDGIYHGVKPITNFFRSTKPPQAPQKAEGGPSTPLLSEPTSSKRKASTSIPSTPASPEPRRKRPVLTRLSSHPSFKRVLTFRPARPPTTSPLFSQAPEGPTFDLDSASDRSVSVSSQDTGSLASSRSDTRALSARVRRDAADARRVLRTIQQVKDGTYKVKKGGPQGKYLIHRTLHPSGYKFLQEVELAKAENRELLEYVNGDKFRFDYTRRPYKGDKQFVIHMPSAFHEAMAGQLNRLVEEWRSSIANGTLCKVERDKKETMKVAGEIRATIATRVEYEEPYDDRMEPDLSFTCEGCQTPDLLFEVAWSQRNVKLPDRAMRYISGTSGAIQTVVGLNMNDIYRRGRRATFSIWKAEQDGNKWKAKALVEGKEFLDRNGDVIEDCKLPLTLKDFICAGETAQIGDFEDVPFDITSAMLYDAYQYAFKKHISEEARKGIKSVQKKVTNALEKIVKVERIVQERRTGNVRRRIATRRKETADSKAMISEVEAEIADMKKIMQDVEEKMGKVLNRKRVMREVEGRKVVVDNQLAELETKLAEVRAEEERLIEPDGGSKRSRLRSAFRSSSKN
ncbi:hypothetical protein GGR51DRAFT_563427 [Nemania sp. FL0031]|nr:hypothetical protein GGR51DRAFT_563427 [Nemania sp. FL0031]